GLEEMIASRHGGGLRDRIVQAHRADDGVVLDRIAPRPDGPAVIVDDLELPSGDGDLRVSVEKRSLEREAVRPRNVVGIEHRDQRQGGGAAPRRRLSTGETTQRGSRANRYPRANQRLKRRPGPAPRPCLRSVSATSASQIAWMLEVFESACSRKLASVRRSLEERAPASSIRTTTS